METIAAPVSAPGQGAVAIVRLSGKQAKKIVAPFLSKGLYKPRYVYTCDFKDKEGKHLDQLCVVFFQGPASFTGEDVVELYTHGSPFIVKKILSCLCDAGAKMARAGEFSRRAYMNGKMSLEQVQAIPDLIEADNQLAHDIAISHLQGKLSERIGIIKKEFLTIVAQIEGSIDFPDEVPEIDRDKLKQTLKRQYHLLNKIIENQAFGRILQQGPKILIVGPPNVGKSSLFNLLLGESRALVSNQAGTTRDFLEARLSYQGAAYIFYDCAGIHEAQEGIEKAGIEKINQLIQQADLCLWVHDMSNPLLKKDQQEIESMVGVKPVLHVLNKSELQISKENGLRKSYFFNVKEAVKISCYEERGVEALFQKIDQFFNKDKILDDLDCLCSIRQEKSLRCIAKSMKQLLKQSTEATFDDLLVIELKQLLMHCDDITGETLHEAVLDDIFSRFCVGK